MRFLGTCNCLAVQKPNKNTRFDVRMHWSHWSIKAFSQTITWDKQKWFTRISPAEKHLPGWGVPWLFLAGYVAFLQHYEELYWGHLIYYTDLYCNTMVAPPMSHDRDSSIIESSHELALQCLITVSCRYYMILYTITITSYLTRRPGNGSTRTQGNDLNRR